MSGYDSLAYLREFERRLVAIDTDPAQERFVRGFVSDIANSAPIEIVRQLSLRLVEIRKAELRRAGESN